MNTKTNKGTNSIINIIDNTDKYLDSCKRWRCNRCDDIYHPGWKCDWSWSGDGDGNAYNNYDTDDYETDDYDSDGIQVPSKGGCLGWCGSYLNCSYCKESKAYWAFCSTEKCPNYKGEPNVRIKNAKKNKKGEIICNYCAKNEK